MSRIRLNQEYRNKIANRIKVHLQQEDTHEKQTYDNLKGDQIQLNDDAWKMAEKIVRRHYTEDDVAKAWYLQNKFENNFVNSNSGVEGIANSLARNYMLKGNTNLINEEIDIYRSITREEIRDVAKKYLQKNMRVDMDYLPKKSEQ